MTETNWAGNYAYGADRLHMPKSLVELQEIVAAAPRVRVLGTRYSFSGIADSTELVSLGALPCKAEVNHQRGTVTVGASMPYATLAWDLFGERVALHNLPSVLDMTVAGAIQTATHGSGDASGNLATAVVALEFVDAYGDVRFALRGDNPDFGGLVVGLGAAGVVTSVELDVQPAYRVSQRVYEGLTWQALYDHFAEITGSGYSVSVFTSLRPDRAGRVWVKSLTTTEPERRRPKLFGARAAKSDCHPIGGRDTSFCTAQHGASGTWSQRLSHFESRYIPTARELHSEYFVPRSDAIEAIEAIRALAEHIRPQLLVCEIRTVARDELWMSPQYARDSVGIQFTWHADEPRAVAELLTEIEAALAPFEARPHWGGLFHADAATIARVYPRHQDFLDLIERSDPTGKFRNGWFETHVRGNRAATGITRPEVRIAPGGVSRHGMVSDTDDNQTDYTVQE